MQTFLPYKNFFKSAEVLDNKRLNNQINEAIVILKSNLGIYKTGGWSKHPAAKMWKGYEGNLREYIMAMTLEFNKRFKKIRKLPDWLTDEYLTLNVSFPLWWLTDDFCKAHQSNLLRKSPDWYKKFGWNVTDKLNYIWPVQ